MGGIILAVFMLSVILFASIVKGDERKTGKFVVAWFAVALVCGLIGGF